MVDVSLHIGGRFYFSIILLALGYNPQPSKCFVVVDSSSQSPAENTFGDLGINVVTGYWFLGGSIGDPAQRQDFVLQKVHK